MKVQEYISSGVLEAFVMNELAPKEASKVLDMAEKHAAVKEEIQLIEATLEKFANAEAIAPPAYLKQAALNFPSSPAENPESTTNTHYWRFAAVIAMLISLGSMVLWYVNSQKLSGAKKRISELEIKQHRLSKNLDNTYQTLAEKENQVALLAADDTRVIELTGRPIAPDGSVNIYWNSKDETVLLTVNNLPELPTGSQYQLWFLEGGKPFDAGLLDIENSIQFMKNVTSAEAFAITIEPIGGSKSPTLDKMVVFGVVG